jgi:hypothetical protein
VLNLKGLEKAGKRNAKMENASEAMEPNGTVDGRGFGGIAMAPRLDKRLGS